MGISVHRGVYVRRKEAGESGWVEAGGGGGLDLNWGEWSIRWRKERGPLGGGPHIGTGYETEEGSRQGGGWYFLVSARDGQPRGKWAEGTSEQRGRAGLLSEAGKIRADMGKSWVPHVAEGCPTLGTETDTEKRLNC